MATIQERRVEHQSTGSPAESLNGLEVKIIDLFVQFSHVLRRPKSVAGVYGVLFGGSLDRIERLTALVQGLPVTEWEPVRTLVRRLQGWEKKTLKVLPSLLKSLES